MKFFTWFGATSGKNRMSISPALVCSSATLFSYWLIGFFSSATVVGAAGGGTVASVAVALLAVMVSVCVAAVPLFALLAGEHAATATASRAEVTVFKSILPRGLGRETY